MPKNQIVTGIDIGSHTTRVAVCDISGSDTKRPPKILGVGTAPTHGIHHGYVINRNEVIKSVQQAIKAAERDSGNTIKAAYIAMGGISLDSESVATTISVENHAHEVTHNDLTRAIESAEDILIGRTNNLRILHTIPMKYKLDGRSVLGNPLGMKGKKLSAKVLFVTCFEHHFEELVSVVNDAGIDVIDVVAAPLAASVPTLKRSDRMAGAALVDIGAETVSIAAFEDNNLLSLEVFPIGSTDITNDIALGFQIPLDEAEKVKLGSPNHETEKKLAKAKIDEIIKARLADIFELIDRHLDRIHRKHLLPAGIVLTGGGAIIGPIEEFARDYLKLPIRVTKGHTLHTNKRKLNDSSWYVAYGLCYLVGSDMVATYRGPSPAKQLMKQTKESVKKFFKQLIP